MVISRKTKKSRITRQDQAEEGSRENDDCYRQLFETMMRGIVYQDSDGKVTSMNKAAYRILGKSPAEFIEQTPGNMEHHPIREDGMRFPVNEHPAMVALATGFEIRDVTMGVFNPRENGYRWINIDAVPLFRDGETKPYQVYTVITDVTDISNRKRTEEALRESQERLTLAANNAQIGLFDWNFQTDELRWTTRYDIIFGYAPSATTRKYRDWADRIHPEDLPWFEERLRRVIAEHKPFHAEHRVLWPNGSVHWVDVNADFHREDDGRCMRMLGAVRDITERKKADEVMSRLAAIVESAEDAIIGKDLNGEIQTWNVGAEKLFGYKAEEVIGRHISLLVPPGHNDEIPEILRRIEQGEQIENFETVHMRKEGTIVPVSLKFSPIKDATGKVIGASKIAHDITKRKKTDEIMSLLAAIVVSAEDAIIGKDLNGNIQTWNVGAVKLFGYKEEEVIGKHISFLVPPGHTDNVPEILKRIKRGEQIENLETVHIRKDGSIINVSLTFSPIKNARGKVIGASKIAHDITERKKAEQAQA